MRKSPTTPWRLSPHRRPQQGLGVIAALLVLVLLSALAASIVRLNWSQQVGSSQDLLGAKASLAASAGAEWGLYQALRGTWAGCSSASQTLDLRSTMGFWVTVTCSSPATAFVEGSDATGAPRSVRVYKIDAVACNGTASCPDNARATTSTYIERHRQVVASSIDTDS